MAVDLVKKIITGKGPPRMGFPPINKTNGKGAPRIGMYTPPLFYSYPPYVTGHGVKEKKAKENRVRKRLTVRQEQPVQQYSNSRSNTVKPKFHKNIPLTNHDLIKCCKYLNIPINVLSRNENAPHIISNIVKNVYVIINK